MIIGISDICSAFDDFTIGSKVINKKKFWDELSNETHKYEFDKASVPGQGFLVVPGAIPCVSAGDGKKTKNKDDYVIAMHREQPGLYLKRELAGEVKFCACVVYTKEAYFKDPEVDPNENVTVMGREPTHILVAVIASSGPDSPLTPYRFVSNLAGGNKEALLWSGDEIREKAEKIKEYWDAWSVVAG